MTFANFPNIRSNDPINKVLFEYQYYNRQDVATRLNIHTLQASLNISQRMRKRYSVLISLRNDNLRPAKHSLSRENLREKKERREKQTKVFMD